MKTQIISKISGCFLSILSVSSSFAQEQDFKELPPITVTATSSTISVNASINKTFEQFFKNVSHLRWYQVGKNFLAKFIQNDQENRALFTKNGYLVYHISYGAEKHLPSEVRKLIKSSYFDYSIETILKVFQDNRTVWVVNLVDDKNWVIVKVEDGEMEEVKTYKKG
jgi:hypothetical protein